VVGNDARSGAFTGTDIDHHIQRMHIPGDLGIDGIPLEPDAADLADKLSGFMDTQCRRHRNYAQSGHAADGSPAS